MFLALAAGGDWLELALVAGRHSLLAPLRHGALLDRWHASISGPQQTMDGKLGALAPLLRRLGHPSLTREDQLERRCAEVTLLALFRRKLGA